MDNSCGQFYDWASFPCWDIHITFSTPYKSRLSKLQSCHQTFSSYLGSPTHLDYWLAFFGKFPRHYTCSRTINPISATTDNHKTFNTQHRASKNEANIMSKSNITRRNNAMTSSSGHVMFNSNRTWCFQWHRYQNRKWLFHKHVQKSFCYNWTITCSIYQKLNCDARCLLKWWLA